MLAELNVFKPQGGPRPPPTNHTHTHTPVVGHHYDQSHEGGVYNYKERPTGTTQRGRTPNPSTGAPVVSLRRGTSMATEGTGAGGDLLLYFNEVSSDRVVVVLEGGMAQLLNVPLCSARC